MVAHDDQVDPILQKKMDSIQDRLMHSALAEAPFTPYSSKAQKKKITKVAYQTRSKGPAPSPSQ